MSDHSKSSPLPTYFAVWITLLIGTGLTYWVATIDLGRFNAPIALTIATIKATLVVLFFMHAWRAGERLIKMVIATAIFFLILLLGLTMADYATRLWS